MIGAIAGDIIGSVYEGHPVKRKDFDLFGPRSRFTDDTVLTIAVADCMLNRKDYASTLREYGRKYPHAGYGGMFRRWVRSDSPQPYNSFGNGSAMRVSPIGFGFQSLEEVLLEAKRSAGVTHNHPEGIKGSQATAAAIFLARNGRDKGEIKGYTEKTFGYDLGLTLDEIRPGYRFDPTCPGSVPQAITAFIEAGDYEEAVRNAVSLGGDSDTMACIAGGIAQAYYGKIPSFILHEVRTILTPELLKIVDIFNEKYDIRL